MYKKKKDLLSLIFILLLFIVFAFLFYFVIKSDSKFINYSKKIELCIQLGGMLFTSFALIITYNSLRNEREQKHLSVKPYLLINDIDFDIEKIDKDKSQLDFDFSIINKGNGIANRIYIKIFNNSNELLFENKYTNLDIANNDTALLLSQIRDELCKINKDSHLSYSPYFNEIISDEFYIQNYNDIINYQKLNVEILYFDIYGKKYKSIFKIELDEDYDLKSYDEIDIEY